MSKKDACIGTDESILPSISIKERRHKSPMAADIHRLLARKKEVRVRLERTPCVCTQNFNDCIMQTPSRNHLRVVREGKTFSTHIRTTLSRRRNGEGNIHSAQERAVPITLRLRRPRNEHLAELKTRGNYFAMLKEQLSRIVDKFSLSKSQSSINELMHSKPCTRKASAKQLRNDYHNVSKLIPLSTSNGKNAIVRVMKKKYFPIFIPV
eukprot:TRINITY_DN9780_c0_g1_i6.p1 TRINITY_DN9780_c0_g1~~TRINITY_DN9780_c0_g1_i6.p1  ORF type:complete len:209 (-),score=31.26 TRINITY_DN9780_c0_g1_i6:113-739(-)